MSGEREPVPRRPVKASKKPTPKNGGDPLVSWNFSFVVLAKDGEEREMLDSVEASSYFRAKQELQVRWGEVSKVQPITTPKGLPQEGVDLTRRSNNKPP